MENLDGQQAYIKIGYKATDKDMKCRDFQYALEKEYMVSENSVVFEVNTCDVPAVMNPSLKACNDEVLHYCNNLEGCFQFYSPDKESRYFKVQIKGDFNDERDKSCTKHLKFLEELTKEDVEKAQKRLEMNKTEDRLELKKLRDLQAMFPNLIVGGSLALYLQGVRLKRLEEYHIGDFDLLHPYWIDLTESGAQLFDAKNSGNTFDETYIYKGTKIDLAITPNIRYLTVEFNDNKYRVSTIENVLEFKVQYAQKKNGSKHREDIRDMLGLSKDDKVF